MRMTRAEVIEERDKPLDVVALARDMMPAAEVHPLHLRKELAELFLEAGKDFLQLIKPLLAKAVKMQTIKN